jgi:imidazolonepropionase-like amidohydrolase
MKTTRPAARLTSFPEGAVGQASWPVRVAVARLFHSFPWLRLATRGCLHLVCAMLCLVMRLMASDADTFLLRGGTVHPVTGPEIAGASILVRDGRIAEIGAKIAVPKGLRVVDIKGLHVYPGMIDAATQLGLTEIGAVTETNDINELGLFKPHLRAITAVNPASEHIPVTRANGITAVLVQPGGGIVTGQAALVHLDGWTGEEMALRAPAAVRIDYPQIAPAVRMGSAPPASLAERRRNYERQLRELDEFFENARRYQKAKAAGAAPVPDAKFEAMLPLLDGKVPALIRADSEKTIREAIRFADRQKIRMVLHYGRDAWKVAAELKERDIPVILGPVLALPPQEDDPYDRAFTVATDLYKAGVKFAFGTFGPTAETNPRSLPYQAAAAVAFGLPYEEALKAVTIRPAEILGAGADTGSIEQGKSADLIVTDGDPLEVRTQVRHVFIAGRAVDLDNKHYRLYQKYLNRP